MVRQPHRGTTALLAALLALVCLGIAAPSIAAETIPARSPEEAKLTKVILGPVDTDASQDTYYFHFAGSGKVYEAVGSSGSSNVLLTPDGVEQDANTISVGDIIPAIPDYSFTGRKITESNSLVEGHTYQTVVSVPLSEVIKNVVFPHAGIYTYQVTESDVSAASTSASDGEEDTFVNKSQAVYVLSIVVKNDDSATNDAKTTPEYVYAKRIVNDDGKSDSRVGKVDPLYPVHNEGRITKLNDDLFPTANTLAGEDTGRGRDVFGLTFANEYMTGGSLEVKKIVNGKYADRSSDKTYHIKLLLHDEKTTSANAHGAVASYVIENGTDLTPGGNTLSGVPTWLPQRNQSVAVFDSSTGVATIEAELQHNGSIRVTGIFGPYSTDYYKSDNNPYKGESYRLLASLTGPSSDEAFEVIEVDPGDFTPTVYIKTGAGVTDPTTGEYGAAMTAISGSKGTQIDTGFKAVGDEGVHVYVVNEGDDSLVSPTGIFIDNLPYVLMVGVPLGVFAAMFVARRRRNAAA